MGSGGRATTSNVQSLVTDVFRVAQRRACYVTVRRLAATRQLTFHPCPYLIPRLYSLKLAAYYMLLRIHTVRLEPASNVLPTFWKRQSKQCGDFPSHAYIHGLSIKIVVVNFLYIPTAHDAAVDPPLSFTKQPFYAPHSPGPSPPPPSGDSPRALLGG